MDASNVCFLPLVCWTYIDESSDFLLLRESHQNSTLGLVRLLMTLNLSTGREVPDGRDYPWQRSIFRAISRWSYAV